MRGWCLVLLPVAAHAVALKRPAGVFVAPGSGITSDGFQPMEQWRHQHEAALSQTARSSLTAYRRTLKANLHRHRVAMHVDKTKLSGPWLDLGNMAQLICGICINLSLVACMMLELSQAAGGITEDERLLVSDGSWHRNQRKSISIVHLPCLIYFLQYWAFGMIRFPGIMSLNQCDAVQGSVLQTQMHLCDRIELRHIISVPGNIMLLHHDAGHATIPELSLEFRYCYLYPSRCDAFEALRVPVCSGIRPVLSERVPAESRESRASGVLQLVWRLIYTAQDL
eukprot:s2949_g8.t1